MAAVLDRLFGLRSAGTTVGREVVAGLTTFMAMSYIVVANPSILSAAGMDAGAVALATCLASALACFVMGFVANYPFALAPGMGINAFFAYTVCVGMGVPWQRALAMVFVAGVVFLVLTASGLRERVINAVPKGLKAAVAVGIGLFLVFLGLMQMGVIVAHPATLIAFAPVRSPEVWPGVALGGIGLLVTGALVARGIPGAILIGMVVTALVNRLPVFQLPSAVGEVSRSLAPTFARMDLSGLFGSFGLATAAMVFTFLFVDFFDTAGTLMGLCHRAGFMREDGSIPRVGRALFADALATVTGAVLGTSTVTTYIESAAGVHSGGRTGLTALVVGVLFLVAAGFTRLVELVPAVAVAPALVVVGFLMMEAVTGIDFRDAREALPAFLTLCAIAFTMNISAGIAAGFLFYVLVSVAVGRWREVHPVMYCLAVFFAAFFLTSPVFK